MNKHSDTRRKKEENMIITKEFIRQFVDVST